jgi:hypothetical protein
MPAKPIAGMALGVPPLRYPQVDRHHCLQFAARQRGVWTTGDLLRGGCVLLDHAHAPRGHAARDASRLSTTDAERPGQGHHAERGNYRGFKFAEARGKRWA